MGTHPFAGVPAVHPVAAAQVVSETCPLAATVATADAVVSNTVGTEVNGLATPAAAHVPVTSGGMLALNAVRSAAPPICAAAHALAVLMADACAELILALPC